MLEKLHEKENAQSTKDNNEERGREWLERVSRNKFYVTYVALPSIASYVDRIYESGGYFRGVMKLGELIV